MAGKRKIKKPAINKGNKLKSIYSDSGSTNSRNPLFNLTKIQSNYCLSLCDRREKAAFVDKLHQLSKLTWQDIQSSQRHAIGCEKISRDSINVPIPEFLNEDSNLLAIRFDGTRPMVGYREKEVFHVLWLDRNYSLYRH